MTLQREAGLDSAEILDRVLDKGIVIDAWIRMSLVGIDLVTVNAHVVVASLETYLKYADDPRLMAPIAAPATTGATGEARGARDADPLEVMHEAVEAWNGHDADRYAALLDDGFICQTHRLPAATGGRGAARRAMRSYFKVFPDLHFSLERAFSTRDGVMVSWLATGTPRREAGSRTAPLQVPGCTVGRLQHGKIVHAWNYWDTDAMLRRLRVTLQRGSHGPEAAHQFTGAS